MPFAIDTVKRFREEALRLRGTEKKRAELVEEMQTDALALIGLVIAAETVAKKKKHLEQLLEDIRAAAENLRSTTEAYIAAVLALADQAVRIWEAMWEAAGRDPAMDRAKEVETLRWVLQDAGQALQEAVRRAGMFERPLARLDELQARAAAFPLWTQECLTRWEMLACSAPSLDPERVARAQAAYARGDHEELDAVLARVQEGGPWVKE